MHNPVEFEGPPGSYVGKVKRFNPGQYGFIECQDTFEQYNHDVFLSEREMVDSGASVGDTVVFQMVLNTTGKPQALEVHRVVAFKDSAGKIWDITESPAQQSPFVAPVAAVPDRGVAHSAKSKKTEPLFEVISVGDLKKLHDEKGFAFVDCAPQKSLHGRDVFVPTDVMQNSSVVLAEGDRVAFKVNLHKGMPQVNKEGGIFRLPMLTREAGVIKFFLDQKQYGFITCENAQIDYGTTDVYIGGDAVTAVPEPLERGMVVAFNIAQIDGAVRATDVTVMHEITAGIVGGVGPAAPAGPVGGFVAPVAPAPVVPQYFAQPFQQQRAPVAPTGVLAGSAEQHEGIIKSFNEKTGYGFIDCAAIKARYGFDAFLHDRDLKAAMLDGATCTGTPVAFEVFVRDNKPVASNVRVVGFQGGGPAMAHRGPAMRAGPY
mmetsp:Transcript_34308/g.72732  ORF Transcript_34308/g.72732 Transcript_34308/m.72732 type:complete len:431 (-) Transcript_34308:159-1451(-)